MHHHCQEKMHTLWKHVTKLGAEEPLELRIKEEIMTTAPRPPKDAEIPVASVREKEAKTEICVKWCMIKDIDSEHNLTSGLFSVPFPAINEKKKKKQPPTP